MQKIEIYYCLNLVTALLNESQYNYNEKKFNNYFTSCILLSTYISLVERENSKFTLVLVNPLCDIYNTQHILTQKTYKKVSHFFIL